MLGIRQNSWSPLKYPSVTYAGACSGIKLVKFKMLVWIRFGLTVWTEPSSDEVYFNVKL